MDALPFLDKAAKSKRQPVYALFGDEDFLKRRCRDAIVRLVLGDADPDFAVASYPGDKLDFSTVRNDLDTVPFLGPARVVVVENADPFVTVHRAALEKYAAAPSKIGVLVLEAKAFPETTKLAKALPDAAKITCKAPAAYKVPEWCEDWCEAAHGKKLASDAARLLVDLVGSSMGQLDQEMEKLAVAVGKNPMILADDVDRLVGRSRAANVFHILDAVGDGNPAAALTILAQLFEEGEDPLAVMGALGGDLRKLATIGRLLAQGYSIGPAMDSAGVPNWPKKRVGFDRLVRHLGRRRLDLIPEWLVEINLGLKGGNPLPPRLQVERLVVRLARAREAVK